MADWNAIRRYNKIRSARKAKREKAKASNDARVEKAGGTITLAEIKGATRRTELGACQNSSRREVWTFRGSDWVISGFDGEYVAYPFRVWQQYPDLKTYVPISPAGKKWLTAFFASREADQETNP